MFTSVSGLGAQPATQVNPGADGNVSDPRKAAYYKRVGDLKDFGGISAAEEVLVIGLIDGNYYPQAEQILKEKENKVMNRKTKKGFIDSVLAKIPHGYGFKEELIHGVPNWALYSGVAVFGFATFKTVRKKK